MTHAECFEKLDRTLAMLEEGHAEFIALARPRRVISPHGYHTSKYYPVSLYANAAMTIVNAGDRTATVGYCCQRKLLDYQVPTYFVTEDLLNDLALTEPPKDLRLNDEFKWPMPAMTFMLPKDFARRYCGVEVLNLTVARFEPEERMKSCFTTDLGPAEEVRIPGPFPRFCFHSEVLDRTGLMSAYSQSQPMDGRTLGELLGEEMRYYGQFIDKMVGPQPGFFDAEKDGEVTDKLISIALKIMLVMSARPGLVTEGSCSRPARQKKGKEREALWSPSIIGASYVSHIRAPQGGTHESPRIHWRKGHMRNQAHGPGRADHKIIWIQPMLVGASEASD